MAALLHRQPCCQGRADLTHLHGRISAAGDNMKSIIELLMWPLLVVGALFAIAILIRAAQPAPKFVMKRLLTDNEAKVLAFLETALPRHRVMAQVAMGALLDASGADRKRARATRNRFAQKIVDFVIVTKDTAEVVALVELDDRTHRAAQDAKRDAMTAEAGYRTIRIPGRPRPTAESVRAAVADLAASSLSVGAKSLTT